MPLAFAAPYYPGYQDPLSEGPLCFSISESAPAAVTASRIRAFGAAGVAFGAETDMTRVRGAGTVNFHDEIGLYGNVYKVYVLLKL
jgi:hypothetical protein